MIIRRICYYYLSCQSVWLYINVLINLLSLLTWNRLEKKIQTKGKYPQTRCEKKQQILQAFLCRDQNRKAHAYREKD